MKLERTLVVTEYKRMTEDTPVVFTLKDEARDAETECILACKPEDFTEDGFPYTAIRNGDHITCRLELMTNPPDCEEDAAEDVMVLIGTSRIEWANEDGVGSSCSAYFCSAERAGCTVILEDGETVHLVPSYELDLYVSRQEYEQLIHLAQTGALFTISFFLVFPEPESDSE